VSKVAPKNRVTALAEKANVFIAPAKKSQIANRKSQIDLRWLLKKLGAENVTRLLVEGGGEVNASFLLGGFAQHVAFFYAPKVLGGRDSRKGVAGNGVNSLSEVIQLSEVEWRKLGEDLLLTARVD
jgi:diaminohydroxyphosphoribosylaminopyrimidine deaminase/5-amino-6-(5-phosphoribosylamino)uracil reductase